MANKIRKGDFVLVTTGKWRGQKGEVLGIQRPEGKSARVTVEGVVKKVHVKPNPAQDRKGGIETRPASIDISNVVLYDRASDAKIKVSIKEIDGKNRRVNKVTGAVIDVLAEKGKKESK